MKKILMKTYNFEDIIEIYKEYFLSTLKEKFFARTRVHKSTVSICKALGFEILDEENLLCDSNTFNNLKTCFQNR